MNPKTRSTAGCLLAGLGATTAALVWTPRAAFSIDGGFEGHARDLSVLFVDLRSLGRGTRSRGHARARGVGAHRVVDPPPAAGPRLRTRDLTPAYSTASAHQSSKLLVPGPQIWAGGGQQLVWARRLQPDGPVTSSAVPSWACTPRSAPTALRPHTGP